VGTDSSSNRRSPSFARNLDRYRDTLSASLNLEPLISLCVHQESDDAARKRSATPHGVRMLSSLAGASHCPISIAFLHFQVASPRSSHLGGRPHPDNVERIIREAVEIEQEFLTDALPCRLIGMNSELMCQYIEFVADRLLVSLGNKKIYNKENPFDFMDMISMEGKTVSFARPFCDSFLCSSPRETDSSFPLSTELLREACFGLPKGRCHGETKRKGRR